MKKLRIKDTKKFIGNSIKVFKNDFEVYRHNLSKEPYYSIKQKNSIGIVFGGDSADADCYIKDYIQTEFKLWDGTLYWHGEKFGYKTSE